MQISKNSPVPLHYQLKNILQETIRNGDWAVGDLFPTDKELMQKYNLSSTTVRRAISDLVQEGWLERIAGKGTFLKRKAVEETLGRLTGFFEEMARQGYVPSAEILQISFVTITPEEIEKHPRLSLFAGQKMVSIEKVQSIDGKPIVYLVCYWPQEYGEKIAKCDLTREGIYQIVDRDLKILLTRAEQTIYAGVANQESSKLLHVKKGFPVLMTERVTYANETPVEYSYNIYRADQYRYNVILHHDSRDAEGIWGQNNKERAKPE
ncbi:MAG: hypothetical protein H6Q66_2463 [Firmicutes bacterium]|nr:hypothetical protein [Bacillota bacterium]